MHTVRFSRDQGRPLACIAHPDKWLVEDKTKGNQKLIKDGWASPIPDGPALMKFLSKIASTSRKDYPMGINAGLAEEQIAWGF
jgi:DNA processing protein